LILTASFFSELWLERYDVLYIFRSWLGGG
jgi:hypothetical protein